MIGYGAVEVAFDGWHVDCGGACFTWVVVLSVGDGESDAVHFLFERFEGCDNADVADGAAFWDVMEGDGLDCFGAVGAETFKFVAPSFLPVVCVGSF